MKHVFALVTGLVFGTGIAISGMMDPAKVLNFFDLAGAWDPSLAFVMGGALVVTFIGYRLVWRRDAPLLGGRFQVPAGTKIDMKLVGGSALFGIGWGIAGFCPGAAIPALGTGRWEVALFLAAVILGFWLRRVIAPLQPSRVPS
ncbi:YeeE/YedE family protein [Rhodobacteraceae bacterium F11138]|nr:YeeE/YedE family protein [Rhodobacteraceae bacterium F11138]